VTLDFDDLYWVDIDSTEARDTTAMEYNDSVIKSFTVHGGLSWTITPPSYVSVSPDSASPKSSGSHTVTVTLNPPVGSSQDYSTSFSVDTIAGDFDITLTASLYDTPTVTYISPALGVNDKVNVAVNENPTFEVSSPNPNFQNASISKFEWQNPGTENWNSGPDSGTMQFSTTPFTSVGDYTVNVRMVDDNGVTSDSTSIDVTVWNVPTVATTPTDIPGTDDDTDSSGGYSASELSGTTSWLDGKYVTVLGDVVRLKADGDPGSNSDDTEEIGMYNWSTDDGDFQQLAITTFDGVDDFVDAGTVDLANQSFTIAARATRTSSGANHFVVSQGENSTNLGLHFGFRSNNKFTFAFWGDDLDASSGYSDTQENYWVGTYDASDGTRKLYKNDAEVADDTAGANYQGSGTLFIGLLIQVNTGFFSGDISEVAIWSRALSETEVQDYVDNGMTDALSTDLEKHLTETVEFTPSTATTSGTLTATAVTNYGIESEGVDFMLKVYDLPDLYTSVTTSGSIATLDGDITNLDDYGTNATTTYQWQVNTEPGLAFDGSNDFVDTGADLSPQAEDEDGAISISAWVKVLAVDTDSHGADKQPIVAKGIGGQWEYALYVNDGLTATMKLWQFNGANHAGVSGGQLTLNQWYHVAGTYDQNGSTNLYIDGVSVGTPQLASSYSGTPGNGTTTVRIASRQDGQFLNAHIDDIVIFDSALNSDEIAELAGALPENTDVYVDSPPIGHWKLDDGTGTTATDSSTNANDGTLQGGLTWLSTAVSTTTDTAGDATYTWTGTHDAVYLAEFSATVVSDELRELPTTSEVISVEIVAGSPIATTGGSYTGGITGGDFSPIQFEGNIDGATEFDTLGDQVTIEEWQWTFDKTVTYNQGLMFDGVDYIDLGTPTINTDSGLTLSAWTDPDTTDSKLISEANDAVILGLDSSGNPYFTITTDVATYTATAPTAIDVAYWHHIVGIYDGTQIKLYVDGFLQTADESVDELVAATGTITTD